MPPSLNACSCQSRDARAVPFDLLRRLLRLPLTDKLVGASLRKYLVAGLLVWLPLAITIWVLAQVLDVVNGVFGSMLAALALIMPASLREAILELRHVPGLGLVILVGGLLATGVLVANIFGQWLLTQWDRLMSHIPIVKSIYSSVKQVSDTLFSSSGNAFRTAVLVQWPREGQLDHRLRHRHARAATSPATCAVRNTSASTCPPRPTPRAGYFVMLPSDCIEAAEHERGRGAQVRHLHGRGHCRPAITNRAKSADVERPGRRSILRAPCLPSENA
jgi:uncharacterized membrane protein